MPDQDPQQINWGFLEEIANNIEPVIPKVYAKQVADKDSIAGVLKIPLTVTPYRDYIVKRIVPSPVLDDTLLGVEVEVENISNPIDMPKTWQMKQDGSLRNHGVEYVTYPTPACYVPELFKNLQIALKAQNVPNYSIRTSVHVHMNVQDMTMEQLKSFVLLYLCFEKVLFKYVGGERNKSIFCIPLSHAGYVGILKLLFNAPIDDRHTLKDICNTWHKYTSLNLKTIATFGTVEFRHMSGTDDVTKFTGWLQLILALKKAALSLSKEKVYYMASNLNSTSEYDAFTSIIFKDARWLLTDFLQASMEDDITHIKECFEEDSKPTIDIKSFENSSFFKMHGLKTTVLSDREKYLYSLSPEQLQGELKTLSLQYSRAEDDATKKSIEKAYREVEKIWTKVAIGGL